jgi:predicted RNA polymerase sigma factor
MRLLDLPSNLKLVRRNRARVYHRNLAGSGLAQKTVTGSIDWPEIVLLYGSLVQIAPTNGV